MSLSFSSREVLFRPPNSFLSSPDLLPTPTLSTAAGYKFYYEGERVAILCLAPTTRKIGGFRFFNQTGEQIDLQTPFSHPMAWLQLTATKASAGEYTCMYFVEDSGQEIPSNRSLPLPLKVHGRSVLFVRLGYHQPRHRTPPFRARSCPTALWFGCSWRDEVAPASHELLLCSCISLRKREHIGLTAGSPPRGLTAARLPEPFLRVWPILGM